MVPFSSSTKMPSAFTWMTMKYILSLTVMAGFLPLLILSATPPGVQYHTLLTELEAVQNEIVAMHNTLRRNVVPPASNMLKMNWSEKAAQNARIWSNNCELRKSNALKRRITNTFCGENIYLTSHLYSWSNVIGIWYNESKYFNYGDWSSVGGDETIDHYTQIVWATSYLIGCGIASCHERKSTRYFYVCHYCHEGNDPDKMNVPYNNGPPCGDCPKDCEDKLCTNPCPYYDEQRNCKAKKRLQGCKHPSVQQLCKATCQCDTGIK
ncbi:cysteine-rich secretory protein 1 [Talpa occidentalis]|uniref:cysteine-rich secretory protein 1 n=1 Tax=Talpa occidentalis TaxID=50954 RepID=UPI00189055FC|nr:cysteine-rich secretory protein 1 [Talpa occidentalis]